MDKVLLFGGRSFLGGHICRTLIHCGYQVLLHSSSSGAFKNLCDLMPDSRIEPVTCGFDNHVALRTLMDQAQFVIHAAIPYSKQSIGQSDKMRHDLWQVEAMLDILAAAPIRNSVFVSVSGTIGRVAGGLADETRMVRTDARKGWGHLRQKVAAETLILRHARNGLPAVIVNPSMCVGEFDTRPSTGEFFRFFSMCPFALMPDERLNIVDVEDVALGTVLALQKGRPGERYILSGTNTRLGALIRRVRELDGKSMPRFAIPRSMAIGTAYVCEILNLIVRAPKPIVPLLGIELIEQGSQHLSYEKAKGELGYAPRDPWPAVGRAHRWYHENFGPQWLGAAA